MRHELYVVPTRTMAAWLIYSIACTFPLTAHAADPPADTDKEYGTLVGQFVFDGEPPAPRVLVGAATMVPDANICAAADVLSEELLVDGESKGIANVFVYLPKADKVHPRLKVSPVKEVVVDQKACRFTPHASLIRTDQTIVLKSADGCNHNVRPNPIRGMGFNSIVAANERVGVKFQMKTPEAVPITAECNIHNWMNARWLILDHPYAAISDKQGRFSIALMPPGDYEFRVWHELPGYVKDVPGKIGDRLKIKITAGQTTDVGTIAVPAARLSKDANRK